MALVLSSLRCTVVVRVFVVAKSVNLVAGHAFYACIGCNCWIILSIIWCFIHHLCIFPCVVDSALNIHFSKHHPMNKKLILMSAFSLCVSGCVATKQPAQPSSSSVAFSSFQAVSSQVSSVQAVSSMASSSVAIHSTSAIISSSSRAAILQPVWAINVGGDAVTVMDIVYEADDYFNGGKVGSSNDPISATMSDALFQSERFGEFGYQLQVDDGVYRIELQFAEQYFTNAQKRIFSIDIEGYKAVDRLDLIATVGHDTAYTVIQDGIRITDGILNIDAISHTENPTLAAITVWPSNAAVVNDSMSSVSSSSASYSSVPTGNFDPRGHEGPLFGNMTEQERMEKYFHTVKVTGTTRIEAEHFATQRYGNRDYRGARWFMVQTDTFRVKDHPEFADRCAMAKTELEELNNNSVKYGGQTVKQIIANSWGRSQLNTFFEPKTTGTGREDAKGLGVTEMIKRWQCNPIENNSANNGFNYDQVINAASGKAVLSLLPDMLYDNHNEAPHGGSNWGPNKDLAPKVYYRVNLPKAGKYELKIRAFRHNTDSGSGHYGHTADPDMRTHLDGRVDISGKNKWATITQVIDVAGTGEHYITLAGREDGFIYDYFDISAK